MDDQPPEEEVDDFEDDEEDSDWDEDADEGFAKPARQKKLKAAEIAAKQEAAVLEDIDDLLDENPTRRAKRQAASRAKSIALFAPNVTVKKRTTSSTAVAAPTRVSMIRPSAARNPLGAMAPNAVTAGKPEKRGRPESELSSAKRVKAGE